MYSYRSEPYDPYIPNSQRGGADGAGNNKTTRVQQQVDEVVGIMQENIDKVMQRGERLDDLRGKTGKVFAPIDKLSAEEGTQSEIKG